jgi:DMSO/TMAO reductase YedYZ heme-binding membrane subunit
MPVMIKLLKYIRYIVLISSIFLAVAIYFLVTKTIPLESLSDIRLGEVYALVSLIYLYAALLISPLYSNFKRFPLKAYLLRSRRALGASAFLFALLHVYYEFIKLLGGFSGLQYLTPKYYFATLLGIIDFGILLLLAITSIDYAVKKLAKGWKTLHRLVYLVGLLIIIHAMILGVHFINLSNTIPTIFFGAVAFLLSLESLRFDAYITKKFSRLPKNAVGLSLIVISLSVILYLYLTGGGLAAHKHSFFSIPKASAHVLKTDGTFGAVLHVEPDDNPIAGERSALHFDYKDTTGKFSGSDCICGVMIFKDNKNLLDKSIQFGNTSEELSPEIEFTFPEEGVYSIVLKGQSKAQNSFAPFSLAYDVSASKSSKGGWYATHGPKNLSIHTVHFVLFGIGFIAIFYVIWDEKRKEKRRNQTIDQKPENH